MKHLELSDTTYGNVSALFGKLIDSSIGKHPQILQCSNSPKCIPHTQKKGAHMFTRPKVQTTQMSMNE